MGQCEGMQVPRTSADQLTEENHAPQWPARDHVVIRKLLDSNSQQTIYTGIAPGDSLAMATLGAQTAVFSYFHLNPSVHNHEKPYEILINLPSSDKGKSKYRRHNQEFEDREAIVQDVRGHEDQFSLNKNGVCWRQWDGPADWRELSAAGVMKLGHERIKSGYIKAVEEFIQQELEKQDGKPIDIVKVFDYRVRRVPGPANPYVADLCSSS